MRFETLRANIVRLLQIPGLISEFAARMSGEAQNDAPHRIASAGHRRVGPVQAVRVQDTMKFSIQTLLTSPVMARVALPVPSVMVMGAE